MNPLHASEASTYLRCPREHHYAYTLRREPLVKPEALSRGSAVHMWLNQWWEGKPTDTVLPYDPIALACCLGYAARYERPHLQDVEVELPFTATIGGVRCAGTVDALGWEDKWNGSDIRHSSSMVIVEHKTTSSDISPGSVYWQEVSQLNLQVSMYAAAFPGATILYDVIRKPSLRKLRQGKPSEETDEQLVARCLEAMAKEPDKYFQRQVIVRLEHEHAAFAQDVRAIYWMTRHIDGYRPRNPAACHSFGRQCSYFPVCWGYESIDNDAVFTHNSHGEEPSEAVAEIGNVGDGP